MYSQNTEKPNTRMKHNKSLRKHYKPPKTALKALNALQKHYMYYCKHSMYYKSTKCTTKALDELQKYYKSITKVLQKPSVGRG